MAFVRTLLCVLALTGFAFAQPTTKPLDRSTPLAAVETYDLARQLDDAQAIEACFAAEGERDTLMLGTLADLTAASATLRQAALKRFGEEAINTYRLSAGRMILPRMMAAGTKADVAVDGDAAIVTPAGGKSIKLVRSNGEWRIAFSQLGLKTDLKTLQQNVPVLLDFSRLLRQTGQDIDAGHFRTAEEAAVILNLRLSKAHRESGATDAPKPATKPGSTHGSE